MRHAWHWGNISSEKNGDNLRKVELELSWGKLDSYQISCFLRIPSKASTIPISMIFPFCCDRLVALKYGRMLHIAIDSTSKSSSEPWLSQPWDYNYLFDIVSQVIDIHGRADVGSQSYRIGKPWLKPLGLAKDWRWGCCTTGALADESESPLVGNNLHWSRTTLNTG